MFGVGEMIFIVLIILLFFGSRKLPELGRAFGKSAKEFKKAMNEDEIDVTDSSRKAQLRNKKSNDDSDQES